MDGSLSISYKSDTGFHNSADVEVIRETGIDACDADSTVGTDRHDHFVDDLRGIGFEADC